MSSPIFAHHAHIFPAAVRADATVDRLLQLLDACGIAEAVCFAPFAAQVMGTEFARHNRWLAETISAHDRLFGFGTVDFSRADRKEQVREIHELGLKGIKLHPNIQRFDVLGPEAAEVYEAAQEFDLFLTFHTGVHHYRIAHYNVLKFDEVAWHFPRLRFSMEHVGGYHFFSEALAVIFNNIPFPPQPGVRPRVFGGLVSVFTSDYLRFWYMSPARMMEAIMHVGAEQFIFGLDFPYNLEPQIKTALACVGDLPISQGEKDLILGGNLRRELGIGEK